MFSRDVVRQITAVAEKHNLEPAALLAICDVESAGTAFWFVNGKTLPPMRPEAHYFYNLLPKSKRAEAVRAGLANPKAGAVKVPANRAAVYARLARMKAIDEDAALMSCSWGLGQVMGRWWKDLNYGSPQELVAACQTVEGQVEVMLRFIVKNHLDDELRRRDWAGFARGYNGAGYRKNAYDTLMARKYAVYKKAPPVVSPEITREKIADPEVKEWQAKLNKVGYPCATHGRLDEATRNVLKRFQTDNGLVPDGDMGTATRDVLDERVIEANRAHSDKAVGAGIATGGVDAAVSKLSESTSALQFVGDSDVISWILAALTIATVGLIMYGLWRRFKSE